MTIKMTPKEFPKQRRNDPKRQAEARTFDALANLELSGQGIYECRWRPKGQQVDFCLWVDHLGRYAGQVKGGHYRWDDDDWYLRTLDECWVSRPSPVQETVDGGMEMHDAIEQATGFYAYVAAVLVLPDMERDPELERLALVRDKVHIVWDLQQMQAELERVAKEADFRKPPKPSHSENEAKKLYQLQRRGPDASNEGARRPATPAGDDERTSPLDQPLVAGSVTFHIERLDQLIVQHYHPAPDAEGNVQPPNR